MSFCSNCGSQIPDGTRFCPSCGAQQVQQAAPQNNYAQPQQAVPQYNYVQPQPQSPASMSKKDKTNAMGGWFKFLINIALFLGALANIGSAAQLIAGQPYGGSEEKEFCYELLPKLKTADTFYIVLCFVLVAYAIFVRFRLSGFKKSAPFFLYGLYVINIIGGIVYIILMNNAFKDLGEKPDFSSTAASLVITVIFLIINIVYFQKRKQYFTE